MAENQEIKSIKSPEALKEQLEKALDEFFENIEEGIQQELDTTKNSWLSCLATRVSGLQVIFSPTNGLSMKNFIKIAGELSDGKFGSKAISALKDQHPDGNPPDEVKQELIQGLKNYALELKLKNNL